MKVIYHYTRKPWLERLSAFTRSYFFLWLWINQVKLLYFQFQLQEETKDKIDIPIADSTETLLNWLVLSATSVLRESFH